MREVITICVGQCGLQVGLDFWTALAKESSVSVDNGTKLDNSAPEPPMPFFRFDGERTYVPRAILFDLEPGVLSGNKVASSFFNPENVVDGHFFDETLEGETKAAGAGNNWAQGYTKAPHVRNKREESVMDIVQREKDLAEDLDGFIVMHSVAGGTGSGMGSWLIEQLRASYPKHTIQTVSVLPNESDVVTQPYNTTLALRRLIEHADATLVIDNQRIQQLAARRHDEGPRDPKEVHKIANEIITRVMLGWTSPVRFPSTQCASLTELVSTLVVSPRLNLLAPAYAPLNAGRKDNVVTLMKEFWGPHGHLMPNSQLALPGGESSSSDRAVSAVTVLQNCRQTYDEIRMAVRASGPSFAPWTVPMWSVITPTLPAMAKRDGKMTAVTLTCSTGMAGVLDSVRKAFDQMWRRPKGGARGEELITTMDAEELKDIPFMGTYKEALGDAECLEQFRDAYLAVQAAAEEYRQAAFNSYMEDLGAM